MTTSEVLRIMLLFTIVGMAVLAFLYLRRRHMAWPDFLAWMLLALLAPVLGPFIIISVRPGQALASQPHGSAESQAIRLNKTILKNRRTASESKTADK